MPKPRASNRFKQNKKKKSNKTSVEQDFDKFRHEIYKFGLSELDKKDQVDARVQLAIKLGAKPKKWINKHTGLGADSKQRPKNGEARETSQHIKVNTTPST